MEVKALGLSGLIEIIPAVFKDDRGYFLETFNKDSYAKAGISVEFVQDNQSFSKKGTIRGLHFQNPPHAQGKLVWVTRGRVLDVVVDIRKDSPDYGRHLKIELDSANFRMIYIPPGFAHGFSALEDAVFQYKCTALYNKTSENGINPLDETLAIDWQVSFPLLSEKDKSLSSFSSLKSPFIS